MNKEIIKNSYLKINYKKHTMYESIPFENRCDVTAMMQSHAWLDQKHRCQQETMRGTMERRLKTRNASRDTL